MADAFIFSDLSLCLGKLLQDGLGKNTMTQKDTIRIGPPSEQTQDAVLGLCLYDIQQESEGLQGQLMEVQQARRQRPPLSYSLYYLIFIHASSSKRIKEADKYSMLGSVEQIINAHNTILPNQLQPQLSKEEPPIVLSYAKICLEEKVRIWRAYGRSYQVSLFYKAAPVLITDQNVVDLPKVKKVMIDMQQAKERT